MLRKIPVIVILGSTGTGKTKLSIELAEKFGCEIISADSMQVYPKLDIVTAKATKEEQSRVKHYLLDVANPEESFTVLHYRNLALPIMNNLLSRKKSPIIVGGTNYYIESLLWDILVSPPLLKPSSSSSSSSLDCYNVNNNDNLPSTNNINDRESSFYDNMTQSSSSSLLHIQHQNKIIELELENQPSELLHQHLKQIDPITAGKLHPNNKRKIIRALEVFSQKGIPLSKIIEEQRKKPGANRLGGPLRYPHTIILWLHCNQDVLNLRLDKRVNAMLKEGLVSELRQFYDKYVKDIDVNLTKGVLQTIGLKEFLPYLQKYDINYDRILEDYLKAKSFNILDSIELNEPDGLNILRKCLEELKLVTIRYSKKQLKWINNRFLGYKDRQVPPIYKLDTSNVQLWNKNVYEPAINIIESYISERQSNIEPLKQIIHSREELNEETLNICVVCKRHFVGEFQWKLHLKSNKHKKRKDACNKRIKLLTKSSSKPNAST